MKRCCICKRDKNTSDFNKNKAKKDGFNTVCRECSNKKSKQYYIDNKEKQLSAIRENRLKRIKQNKEFVSKYKRANGCCVVGCDETEPCCLDFHHIVSHDKLSDVAMMCCEGYCISKLLNEIKKCLVICANHHRKLHNGYVLDFKGP